MPRTELVAKGRSFVATGMRVLASAVLALSLGACNATTGTVDHTGSVASDYRQRHPIAVTESKRTLTLHVGAGRGGLTPVQRAEVLAFAQNWKREATGGVTVDRPVGGPNERAARDTLKEALSIVTQAGVPNHGIGIRPYNAGDDRIAPLHLNYPLVSAQAGPCGQWPHDLGPSSNPRHFENRQYHNFGCASQRNLAAMVANPSDLVQPRAETPAYTAKRTFGTEKWRKGESPATVYPDAQRGAVSDVGR